MGDFLKCCFRRKQGFGEGIERIFARNNAINIERDAESAIDGCHIWVPVELRQLYATNRVDFGTILTSFKLWIFVKIFRKINSFERQGNKIEILVLTENIMHFS